ncbi:SDR family NAD(P)-dependent oxidoreductase [Nocardia arthritidis]|nr:SDR family NAD(P)-dependent oxidoreductase [Nocardia arthritidis]
MNVTVHAAQAETVYPADRSVLPVRRFIWRPIQVPALPPEPSPRLAGRRVAVVGGSAASADAIVAALHRAGARPHRLAPDADVAGFYRSAGGIDGVIDLNIEAQLDISRRYEWEPPLLQSIGLLRQCFDDWRAEIDTDRLFYLVVTRMGGRHGFADGPISQPLGGLWAGLAKSLPREFDNVNVRIVDLADGPLDADAICREPYRWDHFEIGYADGHRYSLVAERVEVPEPALSLGPGDVVVMSGGGRGIGFELAKTLCRAHGCRVIVSGRGPVPDPDDPVNSLSDSEFRDHRDNLLIAARTTGTVAAARADLARARWNRDLVRALAAARDEGLDIVYRRCDVTDPDQVRALLAAAGTRLAGVVHNAGVDTPVRLPAKRTDDIRRTVSVKVVGLLNLLDALADGPPVRFFSIAGSLAGRMGGMVGQLEYAAANEALSRIGLWAATRTEQAGRPRRIPVTTMCWPTWERLGIITNYEATLAYMSALAVPEGLHHWHREILAGGSGERTYIGEFGKALLPTVLRGYPPSPEFAAVDRLANRRLFLGRPRRFVSGALLETELEIDPATWPCCNDFRVDGAPAIPVSILLEGMRALADWVQPENADLPLVAFREVTVALSALRVDGGVRLCGTAEGAWYARGSWRTRIRVTRPDGALVARAEVYYGAAPPSPDAVEAVEGTPVRRLDWAGHMFRLGQPSDDPHIEADRMRDLVPITPAPRADLPLNQLETLVHQLHRTQAPPHPAVLTIDAIDISTHTGSSGPVDIAGDRCTAYTPEGAERLTLRRAAFR